MKAEEKSDLANEINSTAKPNIRIIILLEYIACGVFNNRFLVIQICLIINM